MKLFNFLLADVVPDLPPPEMLPNYEWTFLKMFLALIGLIVGLFVTVWVLRRVSGNRWSGGGGKKSIQVLQRQPLSPKTMLYVIEVDGKKAVIAESQLEVKRIMTLDEPVEENP